MRIATDAMLKDMVQDIQEDSKNAESLDSFIELVEVADVDPAKFRALAARLGYLPGQTQTQTQTQPRAGVLVKPSCSRLKQGPAPGEVPRTSDQISSEMMDLDISK